MSERPTSEPRPKPRPTPPADYEGPTRNPDPFAPRPTPRPTPPPTS